MTAQDIIDAFAYDPQTGKFIWKDRPVSHFPNADYYRRWRTRCLGKPALCQKHGNGYLSGRLFDRNVYAHRAAWAIYYGRMPEGQIDHINGDRSDNRIENLREVSNAENAHNQKARDDSTSGVLGVHKRGDTGRWTAYVNRDGKRHCLGCFDTKAEAIAARRDEERRLGFHENHGRQV